MPACTKTFWPIWVDNALTCFTVIVIPFCARFRPMNVGFDRGDSHRSIKATAFTYYMNNCIECAGYFMAKKYDVHFNFMESSIISKNMVNLFNVDHNIFADAGTLMDNVCKLWCFQIYCTSRNIKENSTIVHTPSIVGTQWLQEDWACKNLYSTVLTSYKNQFLHEGCSSNLRNVICS